MSEWIIQGHPESHDPDSQDLPLPVLTRATGNSHEFRHPDTVVADEAESYPNSTAAEAASSQSVGQKRAVELNELNNHNGRINLTAQNVLSSLNVPGKPF